VAEPWTHHELVSWAWLAGWLAGWLLGESAGNSFIHLLSFFLPSSFFSIFVVPVAVVSPVTLPLLVYGFVKE
jgi:hypothetical protein